MNKVSRKPEQLYRLPRVEWRVYSQSDMRSFTFDSFAVSLRVVRTYDERDQAWGDWVASVQYNERNISVERCGTLAKAKAFCVREYHTHLASLLEPATTSDQEAG